MMHCYLELPACCSGHLVGVRDSSLLAVMLTVTEDNKAQFISGLIKWYQLETPLELHCVDLLKTELQSLFLTLEIDI